MSLELDTQVLIVGGGPVGLFMAVALRHHGIDCLVLEKRPQPSTSSRAIGIHSPCLEIFETCELANSIVVPGCRVHQGFAMSGQRRLGVMHFDRTGERHPFILTLPQYRTEALMHEWLRAHGPDPVQRGTSVDAVQNKASHVEVRARNASGTVTLYKAAQVIACDGRNSTIRELAGIPFTEHEYRDRYVMADFRDRALDNDSAYIFLSRRGLVESIPLPDEQRRWVVRLEHAGQKPDLILFRQLVHERTGQSLMSEVVGELSPFGIASGMAERMVTGRVWLAGDAAHIMSPIGGQGMNVGWLDAWDLASLLAKGAVDAAGQEAYHDIVTTRARIAIRRAWLNTRLGRPTHIPAIRRHFVKTMLNTPFRRAWQQRFTMQGLPQLA